MTDSLTICKRQQPHTKDIIEVGIVGDAVSLDAISETFLKACMIVDAQFYYSNPLLFVFIEDVPSYAAKLYDNYYLLPPKFYDTIDIDTSHIAVNAEFIKHICSLTQLTEDASLKGERKELQAPEDSDPGPLNSLFTLYQEYGLYIIGIQGETDDISKAETEN